MNVTKFDKNNIPIGSVVVIIGRRDTGKSFLVKDLLQCYPEVKFIETEIGDIKLVEKSKSIVVFDNCFYSTRQLQKLHKHLGTTLSLITISCRYPHLILPGAIDFVFLLREPFIDQRKRLYDQYGKKRFPNFESFCQAMDQYTETDFGCLVIANSGNLEDSVFWYRAEEH